MAGLRKPSRWDDRTGHRPIARQPKELAAAAVLSSAAGTSTPASRTPPAAAALCRIPHTVPCPARSASTLLTPLVARARLNRARAARSCQATPRQSPGPRGRHIADRPPGTGQRRTSRSRRPLSGSHHPKASRRRGA
ncbi:DUF6083 domain-containing protein [Streptomyces sp. NPDC058434]|uniref:DUF6083 domain-containing protein n=1 Tax=Streptomyces sp. NPDC058434 TaxID=3346498 RepID=UPI00365854D9